MIVIADFHGHVLTIESWKHYFLQLWFYEMEIHIWFLSDEAYEFIDVEEFVEWAWVQFKVPTRDDIRLEIQQLVLT